jgi:hypothetical protein
MAGTEVEAATKDNAAEEEKDKSAPGSRGKPPGMSKRTVALHTGYVGTGYKGVYVAATMHWLQLFVALMQQENQTLLLSLLLCPHHAQGPPSTAPLART